MEAAGFLGPSLEKARPSLLWYFVHYKSLGPAHTEAERIKGVIPGGGDHGVILEAACHTVGIWLAVQFFTII